MSNHDHNQGRHHTMKRITGAVAVTLAVAVAFVLTLAGPGTAGDDDRPVVPEPCVPADAWTETIEHPAVTHEETIVVQEAYDETVFDHWQRYSWTGGPHASDDPPPFPSSDWQPNVQGDPHGVGVEGAYFRSHGGSGKGDWFYLEAVETTIHHDAVTETITVTDEEAWTETIEHPAVECPEDPTDPPTECPDRPIVGGPCDPTDPPTTDEPTDPPAVIPPTSDTPEPPTVEQKCSPTKCVRVTREGDEVVDREVFRYPDATEEGM